MAAEADSALAVQRKQEAVHVQVGPPVEHSVVGRADSPARGEPHAGPVVRDDSAQPRLLIHLELEAVPALLGLHARRRELLEPPVSTQVTGVPGAEPTLIDTTCARPAILDEEAAVALRECLLREHAHAPADGTW
jgi:hypothetical protein